MTTVSRRNWICRDGSSSHMPSNPSKISIPDAKRPVQGATNLAPEASTTVPEEADDEEADIHKKEEKDCRQQQYGRRREQNTRQQR